MRAAFTLLAIGSIAALQTTTYADENTLASTIEVYVFPSQGQDSKQQSTDEAACYDWAVDNTGDDPFELAKQDQAAAEQAEAQAQAAQQSGQGAGAKGAVRGAAAGAVVGEIANDDASEGAAVGAAAGAVHGRRGARRAQHQAEEQIVAQAEAHEEVSAEKLENFKKAFGVCLEAKEYMVKY